MTDPLKTLRKLPASLAQTMDTLASEHNKQSTIKLFVMPPWGV